MIKSLTRFLEYALFFALMAFSVILCTGKFTSVVLEGVLLWASVVLPCLFPYFFITAVLSSLNVTAKISYKLSPLFERLFNVSGAVGFCYLLSIISGYPVGAKTVSDLKERGVIGEIEAVRASALCSTSSPMFLIGCVGNIMFNSIYFGIALFLSHVLSSIFVGIIFSFYNRREKPERYRKISNENRLDNLLYESAFSSVISILVVGGLITVFYLLTEILLTANILTPITNLFSLVLGDNATPFVLGLFECTRGLKALSVSGINLATLSISAFICGLGGLSVLAQSIAYLKKAQIKTAPFLVAKVVQAVISTIFGIIFFIIFF